MRTLSIRQNMDWDCTREDEIFSSHLSLGKGCSSTQANATCDICSSLQYPSMTKGNECYTNCSTATYDMSCSKCDFRCKHCTGPSML